MGGGFTPPLGFIQHKKYRGTNMIENYDLKTYSGPVTDARADLGIGAVPEGMKRYITYLKINNITADVATLEFDESDLADGSGDNTRKDKQQIAAGNTLMYPDTPDTVSPVLSISSEKFITMVSDVATSFEVTFQYFDR